MKQIYAIPFIMTIYIRMDSKDTPSWYKSFFVKSPMLAKFSISIWKMSRNAKPSTTNIKAKQHSSTKKMKTTIGKCKIEFNEITLVEDKILHHRKDLGFKPPHASPIKIVNKEAVILTDLMENGVSLLRYISLQKTCSHFGDKR